MVEDGEMREEPLLISPCDRLSIEQSDTCGLGSVNDGRCSKAQENNPGMNHMVMGRHNNRNVAFGKGSPGKSVWSSCKDTIIDMLPIPECYVEWDPYL